MYYSVALTIFRLAQAELIAIRKELCCILPEPRLMFCRSRHRRLKGGSSDADFLYPAKFPTKIFFARLSEQKEDCSQIFLFQFQKNLSPARSLAPNLFLTRDFLIG